MDYRFSNEQGQVLINVEFWHVDGKEYSSKTTLEENFGKEYQTMRDVDPRKNVVRFLLDFNNTFLSEGLEPEFAYDDVETVMRSAARKLQLELSID